MSSVEPKGVTPYRENDTEVQFEMHALIFFLLTAWEVTCIYLIDYLYIRKATT